MRTRWQRVTMGMVLGLILALAVGPAVWAKKKKEAKEPAAENAPGTAAPSEPGTAAPAPEAETPPAPAPAATEPAPAEAAPEQPSFEVETPAAAAPVPAAGGTAPAPAASEQPSFEFETPAVTAPAVPAPPAGQPQYRLHKVGKDENLHLLAAYYYGDARQWTKIYQLNKKKIRNPNVLPEGQMLKIEVPAGWKPRFSLPEFMDKERKRIATQGMPAQAKPKVIRETQEVQAIPRLLPADEGEGVPEEKPKSEEGKVNIPSTGETPGVSVPTRTPAPPANPE